MNYRILKKYKNKLEGLEEYYTIQVHTVALTFFFTKYSYWKDITESVPFHGDFHTYVIEFKTLKEAQEYVYYLEKKVPEPLVVYQAVFPEE